MKLSFRRNKIFLPEILKMKLQPTRLACTLAIAMALGSGQALAQVAAPSDNATINLIRLLVEQGVIQKDQAEALVRQAEAEAAQARGTAAAGVPVAATGAALAQPGDVRVPYIPETVREQIRQDVRADVMAQAQAENWAQPNTFPDWVSRITVEGDMRVRDESHFFDGGNSDLIINFAKFNSAGPTLFNVYDDSGKPVYAHDIPYLNARKDRRNQWRIRAGLGVKVQLAEQWQAGIRLASGSTSSPVSTTTTLGGGMEKKDIWLDQAYLKYSPADWVTLTAGRAANPFVSTDMLYAGDLNFDGVSAVFRHAPAGRPVTWFGTLGAFALEYAHGPFNWSDMSEGDSENKWLFGAQAGADWKINASNTLRGALAYYYYDNTLGQLSSPCDPLTESACDTDWSRPAFMQKGNTLMLLRDWQPSSTKSWNEYQYVGLASKFNLLDLNLRWDTRVLNGLGLRVTGNYVRNLAFSKRRMEERSTRHGTDFIASNGIYNDNDVRVGIDSGPNAWLVQAALGNGYGLNDKGDWQVFASYRYIEPDALPDAYNDSSFHLGGTNARGYIIGAGYAFEKNVYGQLRWSSSKEVSGAPLSIDVLQLEVNARF
ncbi:putative porin [Kerstersia gyiorum]|nr:putative porin [Kerstersia gyiorum]